MSSKLRKLNVWLLLVALCALPVAAAPVQPAAQTDDGGALSWGLDLLSSLTQAVSGLLGLDDGSAVAVPTDPGAGATTTTTCGGTGSPCGGDGEGGPDWDPNGG
jgi:hypothetical protein